MLKRAIAIACLGLVAGWTTNVWACGSKDKSKSGEIARRAPANAATVMFAIEGMTCGSCATKITKALQQIDGVYVARVNVEKKRANVKYLAKKVSVAKMVRAIESLGFKVKQKS